MWMDVDWYIWMNLTRPKQFSFTLKKKGSCHMGLNYVCLYVNLERGEGCGNAIIKINYHVQVYYNVNRTTKTGL